jgi:formylglycine-generating enzyme required for sulfatase activity
LDAALGRALAKAPEQRYPSARELADALRGLVMQQSAASGGGNATRFDLPGFHVGTPTPGRGASQVSVSGAKSPRASASPLGGWLMAGGAIVAASLLGLGILGGGLWWVLTHKGESSADPAGSATVVAADLGPNPWVTITPPPERYNDGPMLLGVASERTPKGIAGFRPSRKITPPTVGYQMQTHEVTWGELTPWLASAQQTLVEPAWLAPLTDKSAYPAAGVPWPLALAYCQAQGGSLPTEEQWEYAARGADRRPYPWGAQPLDKSRTAVLRGSEAVPVPVTTSGQDQTPGAAGAILYDMLGNVQEWTADLWREDAPGSDEGWAQEGEYTYRAVRGLPLAGTASVAPDEGVAWREVLCATGPCTEKLTSSATFQRVGFRCARPAPAEKR